MVVFGFLLLRLLRLAKFVPEGDAYALDTPLRRWRVMSRASFNGGCRLSLRRSAMTMGSGRKKIENQPSLVVVLMGIVFVLNLFYPFSFISRGRELGRVDSRFGVLMWGSEGFKSMLFGMLIASNEKNMLTYLLGFHVDAYETIKSHKESSFLVLIA